MCPVIFKGHLWIDVRESKVGFHYFYILRPRRKWIFSCSPRTPLHLLSLVWFPGGTSNSINWDKLHVSRESKPECPVVQLVSWSVFRLSYPAHDLSVVCCIPPANERPSLGVSSREPRDATRGCLYRTGPPFCYLLCSRRQVNCQINPTGQPDYFCFASTTHQFPYF
jgi:hypothetical protein